MRPREDADAESDHGGRENDPMHGPPPSMATGASGVTTQAPAPYCAESSTESVARGSGTAGACGRRRAIALQNDSGLGQSHPMKSNGEGEEFSRRLHKSSPERCQAAIVRCLSGARCAGPSTEEKSPTGPRRVVKPMYPCQIPARPSSSSCQKSGLETPPGSFLWDEPWASGPHPPMRTRGSALSQAD